MNLTKNEKTLEKEIIVVDFSGNSNDKKLKDTDKRGYGSKYGVTSKAVL